jgi:hypothetical protein
VDASASSTCIALDSKGNPHIAYNGNYSLWYASWDGSKWNKEVIDRGVYMKVDIGYYDSLQLDSNDTPHVSYYDKTDKTLRYASWDGFHWNVETLDHSETMELRSSLALDSNGKPHITYCCDAGLKYAMWNDSTWNIQTIDYTQFSIAADGDSASLALDSRGKPHIGYIDQSRSDVLKYALLNESIWQIYTISGDLHGGFATSLALDSNDTVHMVHGDHTSHVLDYVHFNPATLTIPSQVVIPTPTPTPTPTSSPSSTPKPIATPTPNSTTTPAPSPWTSPSNLELTFKTTNSTVKLEGKLSANNIGIPNVDIQLSYSADRGENWIYIAQAKTNGLGLFSADWPLPATGIYLINVTWKGNATYQSTNKIVNFAVAPIKDQTALLVSSNSTISHLSFNSKSMKFSFSVDGTSGTVGSTSLCIAKSLVNDTSNLKVYLDENMLPFEVESQGDSWLVSFTYHHSDHEVTILLANLPVLDSNQVGYWFIAATITLIITIAIAVSIVYKTKKLKTQKHH